VREGGFYPEALEKRASAAKRALTLTLAEMYVQGVSTRKVSAIGSSCAGQAYRRPWSAKPLRNWTRPWKPGATSH